LKLYVRTNLDLERTNDLYNETRKEIIASLAAP
jgi:hypothetical protein